MIEGQMLLTVKRILFLESSVLTHSSSAMTHQNLRLIFQQTLLLAASLPLLFFAIGTHAQDTRSLLDLRGSHQ